MMLAEPRSSVFKMVKEVLLNFRINIVKDEEVVVQE